MRQRSLLFLLAVLIPAAFFAGRLAHRSGGEASGPGERQVLYYVDPMNPSFRSPEPGTAPCGMPLEPVYADGQPPGAAGATPSGAVTVRADRLQLIGVSREPVRSSTLRTTLRLVGTVAADETRLYWVTSATTGRVREMGTATTGSLVAKGEVLGAYYTSELLVPQQNFLRMHETYQSVQQGEKNPYDHFEGGNQLATYWRNVDVAREALMNLGMSSEQIDEITATHQPSYLVQMRAPAAGVVLARNVSVGQSFDEWAELFTIADLGSVWVLADAFEGQEGLFKPGTRAVVEQPGAGRRFSAVVSAVPPRFEAATQTLKVRLDVVNPGLILRPDMLVDVELPVEVGPALFVPKEAVLDSGTRRIVFVEQGEGVFVPRPVRTGRRVGERVEIVGGLMEGETVVTSGNFLLDSESRMRAAGAAAAGAALDPICGMEVRGGAGPGARARERAGRDELVLLHAGLQADVRPRPAGRGRPGAGRDRAPDGGAPRNERPGGEGVPRAGPGLRHGCRPGRGRPPRADECLPGGALLLLFPGVQEGVRRESRRRPLPAAEDALHAGRRRGPARRRPGRDVAVDARADAAPAADACADARADAAPAADAGIDPRRRERRGSNPRRDGCS